VWQSSLGLDVKATPLCRFIRGTRLATTGAVFSVLIADDELHVVELVRVTLEDERVQVFEAGDGETALAVAEAVAIDLVLLDVHLPNLSGLEVCRALRANPRLAATRIVMLTAAAQDDDVVRGLAAGADDYLTKPFSPVRLLSVVDRLLPRVAWHLD
jgi:DNA-binding response OmpR family regulator